MIARLSANDRVSALGALLTALTLIFMPPVLADDVAEKPVAFSFEDQHRDPMVLKPEFAQPMIVAVADREGAEQLEAWIRPLKQEFGDRVDFFAIADVRPVPGPLQGMIRRSFRKRFSYRVAMDWKGVAVERLSAKPEVANLILLNRSGLIVTTVRGEAAGDNLALMTRAIRQELEREPSNEKETENSGKTR